MSSCVGVLRPAASYLPGLVSGEYVLEDTDNRIVRSHDGETVASLVLGRQLQTELAKLPLDPEQASRSMSRSARLGQVAPLLAMMRMTGSVGALASVATVGPSFVALSGMLPRLRRVDGKLDECFERLGVLGQAVQELDTSAHELSVVRLRPAVDALERSLIADSIASREQFARGARDVFAEAKQAYVALWKRVRPWEEPTVDIPTAIEMKNRFVACAIGELRAEFVRGDMARFTTAARAAAADYARVFRLDARAALRARSDAACADTATLAQLQGRLPALSAHVRLAIGVTSYTRRRLEAFEQEAHLPQHLGLEPHQLAQATRDARDCRVYALVASAAL